MLACKVKPYRLVEKDEEYKGGDEQKYFENKINLKDDTGSSCRSSVQNCSSNMDALIEKIQDSVSAYNIRLENNDYFDEATVFVVELPVSKNKR